MSVPGSAVREQWRGILAATLIMQMVNAYLYYLTPTLAPAIAAMAGEGTDFVGWLAAVGTLGSIAFMLAGTPIVLRLGPLRSLQFGTGIGGLGIVLMAFPNSATLIIGNILLGLGYGPSSPAGSDLLQRFAPARHRNLIFSVRQAGVPFSGLVAGLALPILLETGGWYSVVGTTLVLVVIAIIVVEPMRAVADAGARNPMPLRIGALLSIDNLLAPLRAVRQERLLCLALAGACLAFGHGSWIAYWVTWLTAGNGMTLRDAGFVFAIMQGMGIAGRLALGWLSDRIGSATLVLKGVAVSSAATSLGVVLIGTGHSYGLILALACIAGMTVASWNGIQIAAVAARVPSERIVICASGATILVFLGFVAGPAAFAAVLVATASFPLAWAMTAAVTLLALPLLLLAGRTAPAQRR